MYFLLKGSIVYIRQYKDWRETGVAFKIREGTYDVPNRTLASAMVFKLVSTFKNEKVWKKV